MVTYRELTKNIIFMLDSLVFLYRPPTKVMVIGGRFTFWFGRGQNNPYLNFVCKAVLKWVSNHVSTIVFSSPVTKVLEGGVNVCISH